MNSRTRRLALTSIAAALLTACANVPAPTSTPTSASMLSMTLRPTLPASTRTLPPVTNDPYFLAGGSVTVDRDYIERYRCLNGLPLMCECYSKLSTRCQCHC